MSSRGKNFTEREKSKLLELIQKYHHIIENKCTNAKTTLKKQECWEAIASEYNSTAEVPRTVKQLNTAYLNSKRASRQSIAHENSFTKNDTEMKNELKKDPIADENGIVPTGATYQSHLTTVSAQMLPVMADQLTPLSNNYDSASSYYNDGDLPLEINLNTLPPTESPIQENNYIKVKNRTKGVLPKKIIKNNDLLKRIYYRKKIENAALEKRTKLIEYRTSLQKLKLVDLEIKIKEKEYEDLLKQ